MDTVVGIVLWALVIGAVVRLRRRAKSRPRRPAARPVASRPSRDRGDATIEGWMLGHAVAHDKTGFPGDPLPHGHLGSPANLAFWGGLLASDDDEADEEDDLD